MKEGKKQQDLYENSKKIYEEAANLQPGTAGTLFSDWGNAIRRQAKFIAKEASVLSVQHASPHHCELDERAKHFVNNKSLTCDCCCCKWRKAFALTIQAAHKFIKSYEVMPSNQAVLNLGFALCLFVNFTSLPFIEQNEDLSQMEEIAGTFFNMVDKSKFDPLSESKQLSWIFWDLAKAKNPLISNKAKIHESFLCGSPLNVDKSPDTNRKEKGTIHPTVGSVTVPINSQDLSI